jgi:ketosteroid isomerase-like protein
VLASYARSLPVTDAEKTVADLERAWVQAAVTNDLAAMDRIIADDWIGITYTGERITKADVLRDVGAGSASTPKIEIRTMTVRLYGTTAIVNAETTETSTWQGKDTSGHYVLVDVYALRNGRWQAVSSQATKLDASGARHTESSRAKP